jgi:DNA ligase (NAD+)
LEYKFDWVWIELIYKKWKLVQAITRWNWIEWEDVTENIMQIDNIPKIINYKDHLEVRWEIIMPIWVFKKLNTEAKKIWWKIFSNPRNAASWSIRLIDNNVTKQRELKFFAYDLANFNDFIEREKIGEYYNVIKALEKIWFDISSYLKKIQWIEKVINTIDNFWNLKNELDFEVDGLVLKVNNISLWKQIWSTEHHPRYAIAYKFPAEILTTKLLSVEHSIWRTWTITPVAHLEPINIGWVIVKRATLHNYDEIENLDVRIWDTVFIKRAWEVIPKIISVVTDEKLHRWEKILAPEFCPSCWVRVLKDENKVRFYCSNKISCPVQNVEKLAWSVWKQWFNIDWLWEKQVELFLRTWIVKNLVDIFYLKNKTDQILELEWFQDKSILNLIESIEKAKNINIASFLVALWISWVGKKTAKTLSKLFLDKNNLINFNYSIEDLEELEDVWPEIANNVITYFWDEDNQKILWELINILNIKYYTSPPTPLLPKYGTGRGEGSLYGKKVCITWSFPSTGQVEWYTRDNLIKILEEKWGEFVSSVSKNTDFLLAWEKAGSKLNKANEFWVKVLNLTEFLNYI